MVCRGALEYAVREWSTVVHPRKGVPASRIVVAGGASRIGTVYLSRTIYKEVKWLNAVFGYDFSPHIHCMCTMRSVLGKFGATVLERACAFPPLHSTAHFVSCAHNSF
eukprot:2665319-Rhodomonas_salina.1